MVPSVRVPAPLLSPGGASTAAALPAPSAFGAEARTLDGTGNNVANPDWGSVGVNLLRLAGEDYGDGISTPAGSGRQSARAVSNALCDQTGVWLSPNGESDFVWQWGQFLDHDIDLAGTDDPPDAFDIPVPLGDLFFDPGFTGTQVIPLDRTAWDPATGTDGSNPRQHPNFITAFIDASNVYGSDAVRAAALRLNDGSGKLATSAGELPPFNTGGLPNAGGPSSTLFLAGDVRANEQIALTAMHALFVREHNRLCDEMAAADPLLDGEELYQQARALVGAQMQVISYREFLPALLGSGALPAYTGYDPLVNPGISNLFATSSYRMGHSMLPLVLRRHDAMQQPISFGNLPLRAAFFAPALLVDEGGIDPVLRGLAWQRMQRIDPYLVGEVRNFLFGAGPAGFDLAALNIQRGRDHGLPDYNQARLDLGLAPAASFADISSDPGVQAAFASIYASVDDVDVWVGGLAEHPMPGALVGELVEAVLVDQFTRLRDGDRFWYENVFSGAMLAELEATRLSDIIQRNTSIGPELQADVFYATELAPRSIPMLPWIGVAALLCALLAARSRR